MLNRDTKVEIQQDLLNHRPLDCVKSFAKVKLEENAWYMWYKMQQVTFHSLVSHNVYHVTKHME